MADDLHLVTFHVGVELFGVPIASVQEIVRVPQITRIPQAPDFVEGVINLRGRIIPVVEMSKRLGQGTKTRTSESDKKSRILVVEAEGRLVGLVVDEVSEVLKLTEDRVEPAPQMIGGLQNQYLKGIGKLEDRLLILMDLEKVLTAEEILALDQAQIEGALEATA